MVICGESKIGRKFFGTQPRAAGRLRRCREKPKRFGWFRWIDRDVSRATEKKLQNMVVRESGRFHSHYLRRSLPEAYFKDSPMLGNILGSLTSAVPLLGSVSSAASSAGGGKPQ